MARKGEPWYRKGKGVWYVWHGGKQTRLHKDKEEAFRLWKLLLAGIKGDIKTPPLQVSLTVGSLIDSYLEEIQLRLKACTIQSKKKVLLRFKKDKGREAASSLTPSSIMTWLGQQKGWGRSKRWLASGIIKTCFRWAVPTLLSTDPLVTLKLPGPLSRGMESLVSQEDRDRLLSVAPRSMKDALLALHGTGCRPGELCRVEARFHSSGSWILPEHKTEGTGKVRVILLPPEVEELSRQLAAEHPTGPLFRNSKGAPLTPDRIRNWVFKTRRRLGIGRVIPYGFRHTFATDALCAGVPDAQVAELLGHSGTAMLHKHYSHLTARVKVLKEALERVRK